jgi:hypothetical protein
LLRGARVVVVSEEARVSVCALFFLAFVLRDG